jgi:DNA-binding response OmpR family regulator
MALNGEHAAARRVLVVEDNFNIAVALTRLLKMRGNEVIGPTSTVTGALSLIADYPIDGAILDINLRGEMAYPVVDALREKGVRIVFMTGYDQKSIRPAYTDVPCLQKPVTVDHLLQTLFG